MKKTVINAKDAPQPVGGYAQAVLIEQAKRTLYISGQIPVGADGKLPTTFRAQADLCWANIDAQLRAAGMTKDNLVKVTFFLSDRKYIEEYRAARFAYLGNRAVGLTTIIAGIFDPAWLIEIEAIAAD